MAVDRTKYNFRNLKNLPKNRLVLEVVRKFIDDNKGHLTLNELKNIFDKNIFSHSLDIVMDESGRERFEQTRQEGEFERRYFNGKDTLRLNDENIYVTSEWGKDPQNKGRYFDAFLEFAKNRLGYDIEESEGSKEEIFREKYRQFAERLPLIGSGEYSKLYTKSQNKPFKVNKNTSGSIVVRAFTEHEAPMVISANQLSKVLYEGKPYLYSSYEPVLIENILKGDRVVEIEKEEAIINNNHDLNILNMIIYGVPGVGKTHNVNKLIGLIDNRGPANEIFSMIRSNEHSNEELSEKLKDRTEFITFHQSFGYEDFIEGFRPDENGQIRLQSGIFKRICERARENKEQNYYLVIDEINRGNISKIFGELITLIEEDKRDIYEVTLPYSKEPFHVPSNLYIIGTMNSTDKSIALIDVALRRRFTFVKMEPNANLIDYSKARDLFIRLNEYLKEKLGEDYQIGHSYFMKVHCDDDLDFVIEYKIKPMLEEYFYGDNEGLNGVLKILERVDSEEPENDE